MKWIPQGVAAKDQFGRDCDVSGDRVIGGAHAAGSDRPLTLAGYATGAAYILDRATQVETQLIAPDGQRLDQFGISVAIDGDFAAVGAFGVNGTAGAIYLYEFKLGSWAQTKKITPTTQDVKEYLGEYVAAADETLVASAGGSHRVADPGFDRSLDLVDVASPGPTPEEIDDVKRWFVNMINLAISYRATASVTALLEIRETFKTKRDKIATRLAKKMLGVI
jgi:hypothetical protein